MSKIFREERAWKAVWHISPISGRLSRKKHGGQRGVRHYCWLQHLQVFSSRTAETVSLSGAEGKLADGQTDWQRGNCAKPTSPRSAVQTHALTKPCRQSSALPLVLWHITAHVTASPGRRMLHIQRICLDSALFPSSVFLALSHYIKTLHQALSLSRSADPKCNIWNLKPIKSTKTNAALFFSFLFKKTVNRKIISYSRPQPSCFLTQSFHSCSCLQRNCAIGLFHPAFNSFNWLKRERYYKFCSPYCFGKRPKLSG